MSVQSISLVQLLGIDRKTRVIAVVGAGGKTSLMYALARELSESGREVVTTTTAKIFPPDPDQSPKLITLDHDPGLRGLAEGLRRFSHVTVADSLDPASGKLRGIQEDSLDICAAVADHVIVEADGARGLPVKAPEAWEPVIPRSSDLVVLVAGLDCIGKPATEDWVFRLDRFLEITGMAKGETIRPEHVAVALCHPEGGLKGVPPTAEVAVFLNKADLLDDEDVIEEVLAAIVEKGRDRIRVVAAGRLIPGGDQCGAPG